MDAKNISQGIIDSVIKLGLLVLGIFLLLELKVLLVYILVAAIISLIGRPIVLILKNKLKFNNLLAVSFFSFNISIYPFWSNITVHSTCDSTR